MVNKTYHDLYITTKEILRTSIFDLPYGMNVSCNRVGGWCLWNTWGKEYKDHILIAGEYAEPDKWLVLDVDGVVICDSRDKETEDQDDTTRITLPKKEGRPPYHCKPVEELITEDDVIKAIAYDENSQNPKEVIIPILPGPPADFVTAVVGKHDIENEPLIDVKNKGEVIMSIDWSIKCTKCKKVFDNSNDMLVNISVLCPECMPKKGDKQMGNEEYAGEDYGRIIIGEPPTKLEEGVVWYRDASVFAEAEVVKKQLKKAEEEIEKGLTSKEEILARQAEIYKEIKKLTSEDRKAIFEFAKKRSEETLEEGDK